MPKRTTSRLRSPTAAETLLGQRPTSGSVTWSCAEGCVQEEAPAFRQGWKKSSRYGHIAVGKNCGTFMAKCQELPLLPVGGTA